jgi:putative intracellular protease/amidase
VKVLDERLASLGAPLVKGRRFVPTAVADGNLITGQNPRSARATAALLLASLQLPHLTARSA